MLLDALPSDIPARLLRQVAGILGFLDVQTVTNQLVSRLRLPGTLVPCMLWLGDLMHLVQTVVIFVAFSAIFIAVVVTIPEWEVVHRCAQLFELDPVVAGKVKLQGH